MDMVVKIMQAGVPTQFDLEKYSTPLFRSLREKARKRTATEAFSKTADALDDLELAPRVKRVVRRPPPALTIYVRRETEKAYNAIMLEEITVESLKLAVSEKYGTPTNTIKSFALRCKEGTSSEIDDKAVESFVDEDDFIISLDYNAQNGVCNVVLETSS
ncbi:hypothetical protein ACROYT_G020242 [Oculina patagonica]